MEKDLFKDVKIVSVLPSQIAPNMVLIDDDEEEIQIKAEKIEVNGDEHRKSSTPYNSDDEENPINIKITPIENKDFMKIIQSSSEELFTTCMSEISTNDIQAAIDIEGREDDCMIEDQEQFAIVNDEGNEDNERDSSASTNDSIHVNKNSESNDHSYSQPPPNKASFCDEVIKTILKDSNLNDNPDALILLREYTKFIENFIGSDDENIHLRQIVTSLENNEKTLPTKETPIENGSKDACQGTEQVRSATDDNQPKSIDNSVNEDVNIETSEQQNSKKMESPEVGSIELISIIDIKQEVIVTDTGIEEISFDTKNKIEIEPEPSSSPIAQEVEKFKVYVKRSHEKTVEFSEMNQKLLESVYTTNEDIVNGNDSFKASLYDFISFNVELLMDIENKLDNTTIDEEIKKIKGEIARRKRISRESRTSQRKMSLDQDKENIPVRKSSTSSLDKASDSDSDSSINRLTNLKTLDQKNKKYDSKSMTDDQVPEKNTPKKSQKLKKKSTKSGDENSSMDELSSDSESEVTQEKSNEEPTSEDDEELKWRQKMEQKARNNLLASSDEDSYVTSETSDFSSDDEKVKKKKKSVPKIESESESSSEKKESPSKKKTGEDEKESQNISENPVAIDDTPPAGSTTDVKENDDKKRAVKRHRSSFDREIFDKSLLADSSDDEKDSDGECKKSKKPRKGSIASQNTQSSPDVVDLTKAIVINADQKTQTLEKYIEKISNSADVTDLTNLVDATAKSTNESTPKKCDQKSKPPSPTIDDIDCISISSESDSEISSNISEGTTRRRKQLTEEELKEETKKAKKDETERVKKLEAKEGRMSQFLSQRLSQNDVLVTEELILDYSEEKDLTVAVHQNLVAKLKEHQIDGIKFMYNNCYGSIDEVKENNGSGCILAHCMGLGKTLQLIALIHTVIRFPDLHTKKILIICPKSTIHNWYEEFRKWLSGMDGRPSVIFLEDNLRIEKRIDKLREWHESKRPSVFLINYESFRILANWSGSHKRSKTTLPEETIKKYKQQITRYLLDPGPQLVVCDEGHIIKNQKGATNRAITMVKTKRRIILTGTPVQNALHEYYAMVEWIKPNILGTIHEFNNIYANPIKDGQNKDSTDHQIKRMKQKSYVLNKNLSRFVQRKDAQVLKEFLPKKYEYCISIPLTKIQERLYNTFLQANRSGEMGRNLLPIYTGLRKIWTHPMVLQNAYERAKRGEHKFGQQKDKKSSKNAFNEEEGDEPDDIFDTSQGTTAVTNNWWDSLVTEQDMYSLNSSHKMVLLFEILRLCEMKKEKILIFSSFVAVLDIIERFMKAIHNQDSNPNAKLYGFDKYRTTWELGKDYFRLDGSTPRIVRQEMINAFNNSPNHRLRCFLISSKAGGQGINLVAANRCIIVDTSWNPANDNQNIFRIFRLGQKKTCYVYRLVACSTMEERVYSRSVTKEAMSHRVVEKKQIDRHYVRTELEELFVPYELKPQEEVPNFPNDDILRYLLHSHPNSAYNYHEHDSLLENKPDQELNEDEKNEAWNTYLAEQQGHRYQLPNNMNMNMNNQNMGLLSKSNEYMRLFQDMAATPSYVTGLNGMLSSTSLTGLDLGLSSSFFPLSPSFYSPEFFKRFGNMDPLNIYSSPSLPISSSALHSTSSTSTSPLLQSAHRSHNPISALGNMTVPSSAVPSSSYNANNIPLATNSIFAQPSTSNSSVVPNIMPYMSSVSAGTSSSSIANSNKSVPKKKQQQQPASNFSNSDLTALLKSTASYVNQKVSNIMGKDQSTTSKRIDPVITPQNSSESLSILPDDNFSSITSPRSSSKPSFSGQSARTHQVPKKMDRVSLGNNTVGNVNMNKSNVVDNTTRNLIPPNVLLTKTNGSKTLQNPVSMSKPQQRGAVLQRMSSDLAKNMQLAPGGKNSSTLEIRKSASFQSNKQPTGSTTFVNKKQNVNTNANTSIKAINRQLEKSPLTIRPTNSVQQKPTTQIINLVSPMSNDSISITRVPSKNANQLVNKSSPSALQQSMSQQQVQKSPKLPSTSSAAISKQNLSQLNIPRILQTQKRFIDNQTNQTLKRLKIADSQSLSQSQNVQQSNSQGRMIIQNRPPPPTTKVVVNRPNISVQSPAQRVVIQPASSQVRQSIQQKSSKSSQQPHKNPAQEPTEVVELD